MRPENNQSSLTLEVYSKQDLNENHQEEKKIKSF